MSRTQALHSFKDKIDAMEVAAENFAAVRPYLASGKFSGEAIVSKSKAAGGICKYARYAS